MVFVAASDAGGIDGKPVLDSNEDTVQGAWVILATGSFLQLHMALKHPFCPGDPPNSRGVLVQLWREKLLRSRKHWVNWSGCKSCSETWSLETF